MDALVFYDGNHLLQPMPHEREDWHFDDPDWCWDCRRPTRDCRCEPDFDEEEGA
ncbi:MAG: hypothetical protein M0R06_21600 [Sphaerochaeta sp.]|jgi:hypothetical protein|nr:hypothetical protein [Sphaerochaeta sp.]